MVTRRIYMLAGTLVLALGLAGCETSDVMDNLSESVHNFNPFGTAKSKLAGQREALFPEGVPGVQQGIPSELMPGHTATASIPEATPKVVEERPRRKRTTRRTASRPHAAPAKRVTRRQPSKPERKQAAPAAAPKPPAQAAAPPPAPAKAKSAWDAVPTGSTAPAARTAPSAPAASGQAGWTPPASQPVPTIWPDPPKAGTQ